MKPELERMIAERKRIAGETSDSVSDAIASCAALRGMIAETMRIIARAYPRDYPTEIETKARNYLTGELWGAFVTQQLALLTHDIYEQLGAEFPNSNDVPQFDPELI